LLKQTKNEKITELKESLELDEKMDDEDKLERMYDQRLKQAMEEGIGQSINELQCADYTKG